MKISISNTTSVQVYTFALNPLLNDSLHNNVLTLYSLDAFIGALLLGDEVLAITNVTGNIAGIPLIDNYPELPVRISYPEKCNDELYNKQLQIAEELKEKPEFINFYKEIVRESNKILDDEFIDNTALVTSGDIFRAINNDTSFFANQIESPICLINQVQIENKFQNAPNIPNIKEILRKAWNENIHELNQLKGIAYFTANILFFLNSILRECKTPDDIWKISLQYRNSNNNLKKFRNWLNDMSKETDIDYFRKELSKIQYITTDIFDLNNPQKHSIFDSLGIGYPPSVSMSVSMSLPITAIKGAIIKNQRHFRFYRRLLKDGLKSAEFEKELQRVFNMDRKLSIEIVNKMSN